MNNQRKEEEAWGSNIDISGGTGYPQDLSQAFESISETDFLKALQELIVEEVIRYDPVGKLFLTNKTHLEKFNTFAFLFFLSFQISKAQQIPGLATAIMEVCTGQHIILR